jgi:integrase/recombinase XerD
MSITPDLDRIRPLAASDVVQWFLDYFWIRHPISPDKIAAYRADLIALERWLSFFHGKPLTAATEQDLRNFAESHYCAGNQRVGDVPSLTCIRRFYFYLVEVGLRTDDPTEHVYVRMPRLLRHNLTRVAAKTN